MNQDLLILLEKQAKKLTLDIPCPEDDAFYPELFNEQLVRLVVRECIKECLYAGDNDATRAAENIKEYFGVEE